MVNKTFFLVYLLLVVITISGVKATYNVTTDLSATDTGNWIAGAAVNGIDAFNSTAVYLIAESGKFGVYNPVTNVTSDLSATDTGNWVGTSAGNALSAYDTSTVYVSFSYKFGVYNPVTNVTSDLSATDTGDWIAFSGVVSIDAYNSTHVYLGLAGGKFGVYNPVTNVTSDLSATDAGNWMGTNQINSVDAYNSTHVYLGLAGGKFGVYNPVTNVTSDLSATDAGDWVSLTATYSVYVNNATAVYTGMDSGKFGVYNPVTNVWTALSTTDAGDWVGTATTYSICGYTNLFYTGSGTGRLGVYSPVTNTWYNLSATDTGDWLGTATPKSVSIINSLSIYFSATGGKFGVYDAYIAPSVSSVAISPSTAYKASNLTGSGTYSGSESELSSTYKWYRNGTVIAGATTTSLNSGNFSKGDTIIFEYTPSDGLNNGTSVNSSGIVISNTVPMISSVSLSPSPSYKVSNITLSGSYSDGDGDAQSGSTYRWFRNDTLISSATSVTLNSGNFSKGDTIIGEYTPSDGLTNGTSVNSSGIVISNSVPVVSSVNITPSSATVFSNLSVVYTFFDFDSVDSELASYFRWFVNGSVVVGATSNSLNSGNFSSRDNITVEVTSSDGFLNSSPVNSSGLVISNIAPIINRTFPSTSDYSISENASYDFEISASDIDDNDNLFVEWFKNAVSVFSETIISGSSSVWSWVTGYTDSGVYNITVNVSDEYNDTSSLSWNVTVDDTYPVPKDPLAMLPDGGQFEYSIPLLCSIDYVPVSPYYFDIVYSVNGSSYSSLNVADRDGYYPFDISTDSYGTNYSFGCRVISPSGNSSYVYGSNITKINKNNFYVFEPRGQRSYQHLKPYTLGYVMEAENTINVSIYAGFVDCNNNGIWDYTFKYDDDITSARETFSCVNARGDVVTTVGMILYKNNSYSWDVIGCSGLESEESYCAVYKSYEVQVR